METIEQLKLDNAKLTERLNNAAKFFKEQKAQIEALTKENEELKRTPKEEVIDTEKWNALVTEKENLKEQQDSYENKITLLEEDNIKLGKEVHNFNKQLNEYELKLQKLENDIDSKDKAYKILQDTYNEVFAENEKLTNQYKEQEKFESEIINTKVPELETKLKNSEAAYEELRKKYSELKELHDGDLKRYNELEDNYEGLQNKYKEQEAKVNDLETTNNLLNQQLNDLEERYNKSKDDTSKEKQQLEIQINNHLERISQLENNIKTLVTYKEFAKDIHNIVAKYSAESDNHKQVEQKENKRMGSQYETKGFSI